ncbi:restriction endonuclease [Streptomyces sp. NPDC047000]|uniref:restriction endonuclease n=1 Tax=Streptomyces sp. NPDC047000 TaxID=3155474 RepID=UPI0034033203
MINETVLLESKTLRDSVLDRTHVLDKVKALSLLPDGMHVTTAMVAAYFEVTADTVRQVKARHHDELTHNGMMTLQGSELARFKRDILSRYPGSYPQPRSSLTLYSRRAVLNIAMLLRDSTVAQEVRVYLLDMEYLARTQPVENSGNPSRPDTRSLDDRIDQRITQVLGTTVVPLFNALIETSGEHRRELISLRADVQRVEHRLTQHHARLRRLEALRADRAVAGGMASLDVMNGREFEQHVAALLRRDGCAEVAVQGGHRDRGVDIAARTADGRRVAVQCKRFAAHSSVGSADVQRFIGSAKVLHRADVALFVATSPFTRDALALAAECGITAVHRGLLERWNAGTALQVLQDLR